MNKLDILKELTNVKNFLLENEYEDALNVVEDTLNELQSDPEIVAQGGRK